MTLEECVMVFNEPTIEVRFHKEVRVNRLRSGYRLILLPRYRPMYLPFVLDGQIVEVRDMYY